MPDSRTAAENIGLPDDNAGIFVDAGVPGYSRRLTDKILAAFSHAYSIGEIDLAERLKEILVGAEERESVPGGGRRGGRAVAQAASWVDFVEARNRYREAKEKNGEEAARTAAAFDEMKDSYRRWSSM